MSKVEVDPVLMTILQHETQKYFVSSCLALDTIWFPEMLANTFITPNKTMARTFAGFSDIEGKFVDYSGEQTLENT